MKNHIIRTENHDGTLRGVDDDQSKDGFHVFENMDKNLRDQWINFKIDPSQLSEMDGWKIVEWEKDEVRCELNRDVKYFKRSYVEDFLKRKIFQIKTEAFNAPKHFGNQYGRVSFLQGHNEKQNDYRSIYLSIINLNENIESQLAQFMMHNYSFYSTPNYIRISYKVDVRSSYVKFTDDGHFADRINYSVGLSKYEREVNSVLHTPFFLLKSFELSILEIATEFEYANGKYYTATHCYIPFDKNSTNTSSSSYYDGDGYGVLKVALQKEWNFTYGGSGVKQFKKPKKLVTKTNQDLLADVKSKIPVNFFEEFKKFEVYEEQVN